MARKQKEKEKENEESSSKDDKAKEERIEQMRERIVSLLWSTLTTTLYVGCKTWHIAYCLFALS